LSNFRRKIIIEENDDHSITMTAYMIKDEKPLVAVIEGDFEDFTRGIDGVFEVAVQVADKMTVIPDDVGAL
jgi:hypothetical protein